MVSQNFVQQERRQYPRLEGNIPVKLCSDEYDIVTETQNLSRTGAYCRVDKYIEPMTKLKLHLLLPFRKNNRVMTKKVSCSGVIVRSESVPGGESFNIAIYFNDISNKGALSIQEFVNSRLEARDPAV